MQQLSQTDHMNTPKEFRNDHTPYGYLITFRCYGTWPHGTKGSVDRFHNIYGTPTLPADGARWRYNRRALKQDPVYLKRQQRKCVEEAIKETCVFRRWTSWESNVRTNHVHIVVTANCPANRVLSTFKANATRKMREANCWESDLSPWAYGGSKRYLWSDEELANAVAYVREDQGLPLS